MPTTHTIETYSYDELDPKAQETARDAYSRMVAETWDHQGIYDDFARIAEILGIQFDTRAGSTRHDGTTSTPEPKIWYSGFYSQGDGACFEGRYGYGANSVAKIKEYAPQDTQLQRIAETLAEVQRKYFYSVTASITHKDHYYHALSTRIDVDADRRPVAEEDAETIRTALRDLMRWLFEALRKEYEYQTGDKDALEEGIRGNEYQFTKAGRRSVML